MSSLEDDLAAIVGRGHVLTDPELTASFQRDWTGRFGGPARAVVRPADAQQTARVMQACARHRAAIVPQGGNTGLVGGGVPRNREIVLSLARLTAITDHDAAVGQVTVGAGVTLAALQAYAKAHDEDAGLDFAARDSATIGGIVACDAGGARALRHGTARMRIAGLQAVLADGATIERLSGLTKDNAGYDLPALLVGSEGTLGVISAVRWRLVPRLSARVAALVPLPSIDAATSLLASLRASAPSLESCDFFFDEGMALVLEHQRRESPVPRAPIYVLAQCAASADPTPELARALEAAGVRDAILADDTPGRERLWALRDGHAEAINAAGVPHKIDVGVPLSALRDFLAQVARVAPRVILFGHLADGNVHVNLLGADDDADAQVIDLVLRHGGTISAEHGIGVAKAHWLEKARGAADYRVMRAIKRALDPDGLLNPGVVLSQLVDEVGDRVHDP